MTWKVMPANGQRGDADPNGHSRINNMDELDDILTGEETPVEAVEPQAEPEATEQPQEAETAPEEAPSGPERDEQGRFKPKGEESAPPAEEDKAESGLKAGIAAERRKRQEIEDRYAQLEQKIAEIQQAQQPKEPEAPPPSLWEDEQAFFQHNNQQVTQTAVQQATLNARLDMSEMMVRQSNEDFEQVKPEILKFMQENPAVQQQVMSDPHPWQKAYSMVKNQQAMAELGATDVESLKAEIRKQLEAEMAAQAPQPAKPPQSLAGAQSSRGAANAPVATTLQEILGN